MYSVLLTVLVFALGLDADSLSTPLTKQERTTSRRHIKKMQKRQRGPYTHVSWFCKDGAVLPPKAYACVEHGGGIQHGVPGLPAQWLADRGIFVGTVLAALEPSELLEHNLYRARALLVERYLERTREGWVMQKARSYRGARQAEDEERAARTLLTALANEPKLWREYRSLLIRLLRALPPGTRGGTDRIRAVASEIGEQEEAFTSLRAKIHSMPSPSDAVAVRRYRPKDARLRPRLQELAAFIESHYSPSGRNAQFEKLIEGLPQGPLGRALTRYRKSRSGKDRMLALHSAVRATISASMIPRLARLRILATLEELAVGDAAVLAREPLSREDALRIATLLAQTATVLGVLSSEECKDLEQTIAGMRSGDTGDYVAGIEHLRRGLEWGTSRYRFDLGLALGRYEEVAPAAKGIVDATVRSGILVPLGALFDRLQRDADALIGGEQQVLGLGRRPSVYGQYPGFAVGTLRKAFTRKSISRLRRQNIALVRDIPPDMPPVAGIIRVGAAESLSHAALLALNLGIPYAVASGPASKALEKLTNKKVVLGVSAKRRVLFGRLDAFPLSQRRKLSGAPTNRASRFKTKKADLEFYRLSRLDELDDDDSGVRVGPKAAKLARLKRLFPEHVAAAVVIPFGAFYRHVSQRGKNRSRPYRALEAAFRKAKGKRNREAERIVLPALARVRRHIMNAPFVPGFEDGVKEALADMKRSGARGFFVRSDTNVEDLPQFTGAGLNLTVQNQVELPAVLRSIRRVWASVFSERSYRWRSHLVSNPMSVYPSVILQRAIPSELSGVIVTRDLEAHRPGAHTVSIGLGVGAVVGGGPSETLVVLPDGNTSRLQSARAIVHHRLAKSPKQGLSHHYSGVENTLLTPARLSKLRSLADEVVKKSPGSGVAWDIEFGIAAGKPWLFQLRPLSASSSPLTHPVLRDLDDRTRIPAGKLSLEELLP